MSKPDMPKINDRLSELDGWTKRPALDMVNQEPVIVGGLAVMEYYHPKYGGTFNLPHYTVSIDACARLANKLDIDFEISSAGTDEEPAIEVGMAKGDNNITVQELISDHNNDPIKAEAYARAFAIYEVMATEGVEVLDE